MPTQSTRTRRCRRPRTCTRRASSRASCTAAPTPSSTGSSRRSCASASRTARGRAPPPRPAPVTPTFAARARAGEPIAIAGTGEQQRSFVYVEDLAEGVVRALRPAAAGRTYNLPWRDTATIRGLAEIVRDEVAPVEIRHTEGRAGDLRGATVRSDRSERELGWRAATPLREGIRRYAEWVAAQPAAAVAAPAREGRAA